MLTMMIRPWMVLPVVDCWDQFSYAPECKWIQTLGRQTTGDDTRFEKLIFVWDLGENVSKFNHMIIQSNLSSNPVKYTFSCV